ncbi:hypothetical protein AB0O34_29170 [Sphaerisporangium sp. NPDC088356]|uniref:hypothetical protein n=1 Tax=Sphaerisporangium sp. NPDC088356 TaxID=3154871 RepID=UPI0034249689
MVPLIFMSPGAMPYGRNVSANREAFQPSPSRSASSAVCSRSSSPNAARTFSAGSWTGAARTRGGSVPAASRSAYAASATAIRSGPWSSRK